MDGTTIIQVYDCTSGFSKLKSADLTEQFIYWKWVSQDILAVVSDSAVYHLNLVDDSTTFTKVFDRSGA
jgi:clathrin heavy chain